MIPMDSHDSLYQDLSDLDFKVVPRTQLTSIFEGQPSKNKAFSNQNKGHLGSRYKLRI